MYVCICVYAYVCVYVCVYMYACMYACMCVCIMYVYVCISIHVYLCMDNTSGGKCPGGKCPTQNGRGIVRERGIVRGVNCPG